MRLNSKFKFTYNYIFILFLSLSSYSQSSQLQNFTTKEGLPQSQVHDIAQDSIGYLWLATQGGGLARFDGNDFQVFNEKKGLQSNFVNSLLVKNDSLFIGTITGLSIYTKGKFINFECPKLNKIVAIDNTTYLATETGLFIYKNDTVSPLQTVSGIDLNAINDVVKDKDQYLIASKNGLWVLDQLDNPNTSYKYDDVEYTHFLKETHQILGATKDNGIKIIEDGKYGSVKNSILKNLKEIHHISLINGNYWVSTNNNGIIIIDQRFKILRTINQENGLAVNQIKSILKDKQENIWIATSGGGLYKLTQNNFQHYDKNAGLKANRIYAVHEVDNEIWISNAEKGVVKINSLGIEPVFEDFGYINKKARTIASDTNKNIWVGTEGKGILIFKKVTSDTIYTEEISKVDLLEETLFTNYRLETDTLLISDGLPSNWIKKIKIKDNSVWVATYSSGIVNFTYDATTNEISQEKEYYGTQEGIKDLYVNDLEIDSKGRTWYATRSGNIGYIYNNKVRDYYRILEKNIAINTLLIKDQNIYLGTLGDGIWIANLENPKEIKQLNGTKNLNSNNIYQLIFDNENNLWAGTEKGVNKIVLDQNNSISDVFYFDRSDGFLGIETCLNAINKDIEGNIWFGTMNGLTKYIPSTNPFIKIQPTIDFEKIEIAYQALDSININQYSKVLQLKPTQNHLSFQFKSVDINHPKGIEYRWKLNGEFSPWNNKDFIDFANLDADTYEFIVQSRNIDWIESDPIAFNFFIEKPLFEKSWFIRSLYGGLTFILLIIGWMFFNRIKQKNKRKIEKLAVENHLLSLEQKALQLQMNPHFIFNVLNGIKALGSEGDTKQMNTTINTFASLLRSILNSSREEEISLSEEVKTLENYLSLEQQMNVNKFEYIININTKEIDAEEILIPPMLIQPFIENSIKHGFQNIDYLGEINITFSVHRGFLECSIRDNGIGIEKSKKQRKKHHQSMALQVTKDRLENISAKNSLQITEDNGTFISFRIPLKTDF